MKIWLDDLRDPKKFWPLDPTLVWIKTAEEAIELIKTGKVTFISFDHDLGTELDGNDVAKLIEALVYTEEIDMPYWWVHSANPAGQLEITNSMKSAERFAKGY